ncbi:MAG: GerMN domain-containing protein [Bacillota bacterium]|jgi:germination protein M|nr:GerMN domain-containing protein [Bacillota bacterium]
MKNLPARKLLWLLVFWALALGGSWLAGCRREIPSQSRQVPNRNQEFRLASPVDQVHLYYLTKDERYFVPVTCNISPTREAPRVAVEKLLAGASQESLTVPFPPDVKLHALVIEGNVVTLDLTGEVQKIKEPEAARRAFEALVLTLTEFREVKAVKILVNGSPLASLAGYSLNQPLVRPPYLNLLSARDTGNPAIIYFTDNSGLYLVPVTIFLPDRDHSVAGVLKLLVAGPPAGSSLGPPVWPGTKVLRVEESNGIVTVDLSSEVLAYGGGSAQELALINALVFTLTEFPQVKGVQLLIEGKKRLFLPEGTEVAQPLQRPRQLNPIAL